MIVLIERLKKDSKVIIFDGTQITNKSTTGGFAEYGRNAKKTSKTQVCEIKVFDASYKEPIYYELLPGNIIDKTAFSEVLKRFDIKSSTIIVDKGFNTKANIDYLNENNYTYLIPYNDNAKIIEDIFRTHTYTDVFKYNGKSIKCMKVKLDDKIYYVYRDPFIAAAQESNYIKKITDNKKRS